MGHKFKLSKFTEAKECFHCLDPLHSFQGNEGFLCASAFLFFFSFSDLSSFALCLLMSAVPFVCFSFLFSFLQVAG